MAEETPLQKAIREAKEKTAQKAKDSNPYSDMDYDTYLKKKGQKVSTQEPANGSKTSGTQSPTSQTENDTVEQESTNTFNLNPITLGNGSKSNIGYREGGIGGSFKDNINGNYASPLEKAQSEKLKEIQGAYQGDQNEIAKAQESPIFNGEIQQGLEIENKWGRSKNLARHYANEGLIGLGVVASGLGDEILTLGIKSGLMPKEVQSAYRNEVQPTLRTHYKDQLGFELDVRRENEYRAGTITGAIGGLARSTPAMIMGAGGGFASALPMFFLGQDSALESLNNSEVGKTLDEDTKTIYSSSVGLVGALLERAGIDKIFKAESGVVSKYITDKAIQNALKSGNQKITGDVLSSFLQKEVFDLTGRVAKFGTKAVDGYLTEAFTGGAQETSIIGAEYLLNAATGKSVFDTEDASTWKGFINNIKRVGEAANAEGIGGGFMGLLAGVSNGSKSDFDKKLTQLKDINKALQNDQISESSKDLLIRSKINIQNKIDADKAKIDEWFSKADKETQERIFDLGDEKIKIEEALLDPQLPESIKEDLKKQSDQIDVELSGLNKSPKKQGEANLSTKVSEANVSTDALADRLVNATTPEEIAQIQKEAELAAEDGISAVIKLSEKAKPEAIQEEAVIQSTYQVGDMLPSITEDTQTFVKELLPDNKAVVGIVESGIYREETIDLPNTAENAQPNQETQSNTEPAPIVGTESVNMPEAKIESAAIEEVMQPEIADSGVPSSDLKEENVIDLDAQKPKPKKYNKNSRTAKQIDREPNSFNDSVNQFFIGEGKLSTEDFITHTGFGFYKESNGKKTKLNPIETDEYLNKGQLQSGEKVYMSKELRQAKFNKKVADRKNGGIDADMILQSYIPNAFSGDQDMSGVTDIVNAAANKTRGGMLKELEASDVQFQENGNEANFGYTGAEIAEMEALSKSIDENEYALSDEEINSLAEAESSNLLQSINNDISNEVISVEYTTILRELTDKYTNEQGIIDWIALENDYYDTIIANTDVNFDILVAEPILKKIFEDGNTKIKEQIERSKQRKDGSVNSSSQGDSKNVTGESEGVERGNESEAKRSEARLDNGRTMEGNPLFGPLDEPEKRSGVYQTIEASNDGGSSRSIREIEEREELEARGAEIKPEISNGSTSKELGSSDGIYSGIEEIANVIERSIKTAKQEQQGQMTKNEIEDLEKRLTFDFAKNNKLWIKDFYDLGSPFIGGGNENTLAYDEAKGIIYKSNNLFNSKNSIITFLEQTANHNAISPNTRYEIVGFTGIDNGTKRVPYIEPILKQEYIIDAVQASQIEIDDYMSSLGFEKVNNHTFKNSEYKVSDLHPRNVLKDPKGNIYVVDDIVIKNKEGINEVEQEQNTTSDGEVQPKSEQGDEQSKGDNIQSTTDTRASEGKAKIEKAKQVVDENQSNVIRLQNEVNKLSEKLAKNLKENQANMFGNNKPQSIFNDKADQQKIFNDKVAELREAQQALVKSNQDLANLKEAEGQVELAMPESKVEIDGEVVDLSETTPKQDADIIVKSTLNPFKLISFAQKGVDKLENNTTAALIPKITDMLAETLQAWRTSKNTIKEVASSIASSFFGGIARTDKDVSIKLGLIGGKNMAVYNMGKLMKSLYGIIDNNTGSLERIHVVMDPDFYQQGLGGQSNAFKLKKEVPTSVKTESSKIYDDNSYNVIGSKQEYQEYLQSIFPNSNINDIVYHGTSESMMPKDGKFKGYVTYLSTDKGYSETFGFPVDRKVLSVLVDVKNPFNAKDELADVPLEIHNKGEFTNARIIKQNNTNNYDSVVGIDLGQKNGKTIVAFNSDQIHILGSKADEKGFKDYINNKPKNIQQDVPPNLTYNDLTAEEKMLHDELRKNLDEIHFKNYALGFIDVDTFNKHKGTYVPRMYETNELPAETQEILDAYNKQVGTKLNLNPFKKRKDLDQLSDDSKNAILKDPVYLMAKRMMELDTNSAIQNYINHVNRNNKNLVYEGPDADAPFQFVKLEGKAYGALNGKYVAGFVAEDLKGYFFVHKELNTFYDGIKMYDRTGARQFVKKGLTVFNPFVQLGNFTSNVVFAQLGGVDFVRWFGNTPSAIKELMAKGSDYETLLAAGLIGTDVVTSDLTPNTTRSNSILQQKKDNEKGGLLKKLTSPFTKASDKATQLYSGNDDYAKINAYQIYREQGYTEAEALKKVYDAFQNYATVGKFWDVAAKTPVFGPVFVKFAADLMRITGNAVAKKPLSSALYLAGLMLIPQILKSIGASEEEDELKKELRTNRPFIPKMELGFINIPLVYKTKIGEINLARYITPYYFFDSGDDGNENILPGMLDRFNPYKEVKSQGYGKGNESEIAFGQDPVLGTLYNIMLDTDFRGKSIQDPQATRFRASGVTNQEKWMNRGTHALRTWIPNGALAHDTYLNAKYGADSYGRTRTMAQTLINFAIKIQNFKESDYKKTAEKQVFSLTNDLRSQVETIKNTYVTDARERQSKQKSLADGSLSKEDYQRSMEKLDETLKVRIDKAYERKADIDKKLSDFTTKYKRILDE